MTEPVTLPAWFDAAFGHLNTADRAEVEGLWRDEPALRTLALLLDTLRPDTRRFRACPRCGHRAPRWNSMKGNSWRGHCTACGEWVIASEGTPFHRISKACWPRLYTTLVLKWGPWTPVHAWRIAGCSTAKQFANYRRRLQPLFDELPADMPWASRVRYRLDISPARQGFRCPYCGSDDLRNRSRSPADKLVVCCCQCGKRASVNAAYVRNGPLPPDMHCPECGGRNLRRHNSAEADGRRHYLCRDCGRSLVDKPKLRYPTRAERASAVVSGIDCPTCSSDDIRLRKLLSDGRTVYQCARCRRTFSENSRHTQPSAGPRAAPGAAKTEGGGRTPAQRP